MLQASTFSLTNEKFIFWPIWVFSSIDDVNKFYQYLVGDLLN